jgi:hypothetical protein
MAASAVSISFIADTAPIRAALAGMENASAKAANALISDLRRSYAEQVRGAAAAAKAATVARQQEAAATSAALARVAEEAERVRLGPDAFSATNALRELDALEARLKALDAADAAAMANIAARRGQLQGDLARAGSTSGEMQGPAQAPAAPSKAMQAYSAALVDLDRRSQAAAASQRGLQGGLQAVAMQMPDVIAQLSAGAPPLQVLTQQGSQVGQQMLAASGSVGGLAAALAPLAPLIAALAVAVAGVTAAYSVWANATDKAADASGRIEERIVKADAAIVRARQSVAGLAREWAAYSQATREAAEDVQVQIGGLSGVRIEAERAEAAARKQADAAVKAQADLVASIGQRIAAEEQLRLSGRLTMSADIESARVLGEMRDAHKAATARLGEMRGAQDQAGLAAYALAEAQAEEAQAAKRAADAQRGHTTALDATREALRRLAEADADYKGRVDERAAAVAGLRSIIEGAGRFEEGSIGRIIRERDEQLAQIDAMAAASGRLDLAAQASADVRLEAERKLAVELAAIEAERESRAAAAAEREMQRVEQVRALTIQGASQMFGGLASSAQMAADLAASSSESAARRAFVAYKALAIAQATIDALAAAARAGRDYPFPLSVGVAASAYATGAARVATIAATEPSFHTGGMVSDPPTAPDEVRAKLTRGEGVLTARGVANVGGPDGLAKLNRGAAVASPAPVAVLVPPDAPSRLFRDAVATREGRDLARRATRNASKVAW